MARMAIGEQDFCLCVADDEDGAVFGLQTAVVHADEYGGGQSPDSLVAVCQYGTAA